MSGEATISKLKKIVAEDFMTEQVSVIHQTMLVGQVAHMMLREKVSGYPISNELGRVVGIVTMTDLFVLIDKIVKVTEKESSHLSAENRELAMHQKISEFKNKSVTEIMSRNVLTISPKTSLAEIIEFVANWHIHTFPVMENDKLVGIISRHDVLNAVFVYG